MSYTKGSWIIVYNERGYPYGIDAPNGNKGAGGIINVTRWNAISFPSSEEGQANAHLIAAAPDLLEALEELYENCEAGGKYLDKADAAIKKAKS